MAAAVKSDKLGGPFRHMHLILKEKEYRIATNDKNATVNLLKKSLKLTPRLPNLEKRRTNLIQCPQTGGWNKATN
jgi:hypothetical protein